MNQKGITGVILAGGKNSRMGTDKGMLVVDGKNIVERTIAVLRPLVNEIIVISNGNNYDYLGLSVYNDIIPACGPMGGIYTALNFSKTDRILVVSCDMPFVSESILTALVNSSNGGEVVIPEHGEGELEPLCAIYSKSCFDKFAELLRSGNWKMKDSLQYFKVNKVVFPQDEVSPRYFMNVNTPSEYRSIIQNINEYSS